MNQSSDNNSYQRGIILCYRSNFYTVKIDGIEYQALLKGLLKKEGSEVLTGDWVLLDNIDEQGKTARIIKILERSSQLARPKIANISKVVIVTSVKSPPFDLTQLDRYLTHVQLAGIEPLICISKVDLAQPDISEFKNAKEIYESLGISLYTTTIKESSTIKSLFKALRGEIVVLAGASGVGKSSLLNAYSPGLSLAVKEVSDKAKRGQHTTREVSLIAIDDETYVADSPGFSYLKFDNVSPYSIEKAFRDFEPYREFCRFNNCLHLDETECEVKANLNKIKESRYESYKLFQSEASQYLEKVQSTSQKEEYGYKTLKKGKEKDIQILKLSEKQRAASRKREKQKILLNLTSEDDDTF